MRNYPNLYVVFLLSASLSGGCVLVDDMAPRKAESNGLITTPATYYSTAKGRYLGARYKANLDRLVERITRNPKTATLQFANNISSVGGIGFFTHSATKTPDERFLEVVMATPETFEVKGEFNEKVQRLFTRYGVELLAMVSNDDEIYQDREMSGYGLNLAWRNVVSETSGNRVTLERAILYFPKDRVRGLLREGLTANELLSDAVIFAGAEDGPLTLVSYQPRDTKPDVRAAITEANLAAPAKTTKSSLAPAAMEPAESPKTVAIEQAAPSANRDGEAPAAAASEAKTVPRPAPVALPKASATGSELRRPVDDNSLAKLPAAPLTEPEPVVTPAAPEVPAGEKGPSRPMALLRSPPADTTQEMPATVLAPVKALQGFIVQLAFTDQEKAQSWAESMLKRGFAVSLTKAGSAGSLRVRVGNFTAREEAERQLQAFKRDGLSGGIVISLPQAFRPEIPTSSAP